MEGRGQRNNEERHDLHKIAIVREMVEIDFSGPDVMNRGQTTGRGLGSAGHRSAEVGAFLEIKHVGKLKEDENKGERWDIAMVKN